MHKCPYFLMFSVKICSAKSYSFRLSEKVVFGIKLIIQCYIIGFDIFHDFKIFLQDSFSFLLSLTAEHILCYYKALMLMSKKDTNVMGNVRKDFHPHTRVYKGYATRICCTYM